MKVSVRAVVFISPARQVKSGTVVSVAVIVYSVVLLDRFPSSEIAFSLGILSTR